MVPGVSVPAAGDPQPVGIHLGTSSLFAAVVDPRTGRPACVPLSPEGPRLGTLVAWDRQGQPAFGAAAQRLAENPDGRRVQEVRSLLGVAADGPEAGQWARRHRVPLRTTAEGELGIQLGAHTVVPVEVAGLLFQRAREGIESHTQRPVGPAVIAVPSPSDPAVSAALVQAARAGGFAEVHTVQEPTAAALAYGLHRMGSGRIITVDVGQSRSDVSLVEVASNVFEVVAHAAEQQFGASILRRHIEARLGQSIRDAVPNLPAKMDRRLARHHAAEVLGALFERDVVVLRLSVGEGGPDLEVPVDTAEYLRIAKDLHARTLALVQRVLTSRSLQAGDLDAILWLGDGTEVPGLSDAVATALGVPLEAHIPPSEAVALGAALLAESLRQRAQAKSPPTLSHAVGIALSDGRFMKVINEHSRLPITRRVLIPTSQDKQSLVHLDIFQGNDEDVVDAVYLGTVVFSGIAPRPAGVERIVVDLHLDESHMLTVSCPDMPTRPQRYLVPAGPTHAPGPGLWIDRPAGQRLEDTAPTERPPEQ